MNPARKKVPYPICGISSLERYNVLNPKPYSNRITQNFNSQFSPSKNKKSFQPLTTTRQVLSLYQHSRTLQTQNGPSQQLVKDGSKLTNHNHQNQQEQIDSHQNLHFQILYLINENSKLLRLMSEYDEEISIVKLYLKELEEQYMNIIFLRAQGYLQEKEQVLIANYSIKNKFVDDINSKELKRHPKKPKDSQEVTQKLLLIKTKLQSYNLEKLLKDKHIK